MAAGSSCWHQRTIVFICFPISQWSAFFPVGNSGRSSRVETPASPLEVPLVSASDGFVTGTKEVVSPASWLEEGAGFIDVAVVVASGAASGFRFSGMPAELSNAGKITLKLASPGKMLRSMKRTSYTSPA